MRIGVNELNIDLLSLMKNLESSLEYYASIPPRGTIDFEEDYHAVTIDPDGKTRNLLEERESALQGCGEIIAYLKNETAGKILDFGCGLGWVLSALDSSWDRFGLETSKFAAQHAEKFGSIFHGNYQDYRESGFDYIVMNHVIEHLPDPKGCLEMLFNKLNPGGKLILGTPNFDSAAARRYGSRFRLLADSTHISLFSEDSIRRLVRDVGFKIENVEYPYFETPWFSKKELLRILDKDSVSPPFYGSVITLFAYKPN